MNPCKIGHKMQTHTWIELKFATLKCLIKVHLCINFGGKICIIMTKICRRKKVEGLSHLQLKGIGWNLARKWSNNLRSAFLWFLGKDHKDMAQNPTSVRITKSSLWIKNPPSYITTIRVVN